MPISKKFFLPDSRSEVLHRSLGHGKTIIPNFRLFFQKNISNFNRPYLRQKWSSEADIGLNSFTEASTLPISKKFFLSDSRSEVLHRLPGELIYRTFEFRQIFILEIVTPSAYIKTTPTHAHVRIHSTLFS